MLTQLQLRIGYNMAYATKEIDHEKRKNREGSYSLYDYLYRYLMDNYEPEQLADKPSMALESLERKLLDVGREYMLTGNGKYNDSEIVQAARSAITNFIDNNGEHGDTAQNFGKMQNSSFDTVKQSISDLRW